MEQNDAEKNPDIINKEYTNSKEENVENFECMRHCNPVEK